MPSQINFLKILFPVSALLILNACNKASFSDPKQVLSNYRKLKDENDAEAIYDNYFSTDSKKLITRDEYLKSKSSAIALDSIENIDGDIAEVTFDTIKSVYKTFNVNVASINKSDTTHVQLFYTLINEDGNWKIIYSQPLITKAEMQLDNGEYDEVRNTVDQILKLNPFSAKACRLFAESYLKDSSSDTSLVGNAVLYKIQEGLKLEPENPYSYNVLAQYFNWTGDRKREIAAYREQLNFSPNKQYSGMIYSTMAALYFDIEEFNSGEFYTQKALAINPDDSYALYNYGHYKLDSRDYKSAVKHLSRAISANNIQSDLEANLYFLYAYSSFETADCASAIEYAGKAVSLDPANESYSGYFTLVKKYCIEVK